MPPIVFVLLNGLFLLLLYVFVARAVRAVVRDVNVTTGHSGASQRVPRGTRRRSAAAAASAPRKGRGQPREIVVHPPEGPSRVLALDDGEIRIGRAPSCTIQLADTYASEQHARIFRQGDGWVVADMGSTNGTYLNQGKVTSPAPLKPGDQLGIGKTVVEVRK